MHYAITDYILDIVQNACEACALNVDIKIDENEKYVEVTVRDDGKGMDEDEKMRALDPFHTDGQKHPGRKVGLGLPFLKQAIEQSNGKFSLSSEKGVGTEVAFRFDKDEMDCPPMGEIPALFLSVLCLPGSHEMTIERVKTVRKARPDLQESAAEARPGMRPSSVLSYTMKKSELAEVLGDLEHVSSLALLKEYLKSQEEG